MENQNLEMAVNFMSVTSCGIYFSQLARQGAEREVFCFGDATIQ